MLIRTAALLSLLIFATAPAVSAQDQPRAGGVLKAGLIGEAPTLDLHATTAVITQQITWHIYETLYTYDKNQNPIPMLAESHTVGDNGRRYTITLRKGVRFHNGKEMTSADVVPSLQHWAKLGTTPKAIWKNVEGLEAKDPYTVVIYLKEPSGSLLFALGSPNNGGAIYPKEVVAAAGDGQVKEYIGTGPYRFVEQVTQNAGVVVKVLIVKAFGQSQAVARLGCLVAVPLLVAVTEKGRQRSIQACRQYAGRGRSLYGNSFTLRRLVGVNIDYLNRARVRRTLDHQGFVVGHELGQDWNPMDSITARNSRGSKQESASLVVRGNARKHRGDRSCIRCGS
jgi:hypothetical protein